MSLHAQTCPACQQPLPRVPGLYFSAASGEVIVPGGLSAKLTQAESKLFALMHERPGRLVPFTEFWQALYFTAKEQDERDPKIVAVLVARIRQKTQHMGIRIINVWARGYYLRASLEPRVSDR